MRQQEKIKCSYCNKEFYVVKGFRCDKMKKCYNCMVKDMDQITVLVPVWKRES